MFFFVNFALFFKTIDGLLRRGKLDSLRYFLKEAAYKYTVGMGVYVHKPSKSILEFLDWPVLTSFFRLDMFKPLSKHVRSLFKSDKMRQDKYQ